MIGPFTWKHLPGSQPEIRLQPRNDFGIRFRFDFEAHRGTFAAPVKLHVHRFKDAARFLLFEIEIAVAGHAKRSGRKNFVSMVEASGEGANHVVQENVLDGSFGGWEAHETG